MKNLNKHDYTIIGKALKEYIACRQGLNLNPAARNDFARAVNARNKLKQIGLQKRKQRDTQVETQEEYHEKSTHSNIV